jgi:hypothetical protein
VSECYGLLAPVLACEPGDRDWRTFADASLKVLEHLFVPPLQPPRTEWDTTSVSGVDRRDAIFPNRVLDPEANSWGYLRFELNAKLVVVDFKNFSPTKGEVLQVVDYLRPEMGRLALICCNGEPKTSAIVKRNQKSREGHEPILLFVTVAHLQEMCDRKTAGEDPGVLLLDLVDSFLIQLD